MFRKRRGTALPEGCGIETVDDPIESPLDTEAAMRMTLLRESLDRDPPGPRIDGYLPSAAEFYEGDIPEWIPKNEVDDTDVPT